MTSVRGGRCAYREGGAYPEGDLDFFLGDGDGLRVFSDLRFNGGVGAGDVAMGCWCRRLRLTDSELLSLMVTWGAENWKDARFN